MDITQELPSTITLPHEANFHAITPYFRYETFENVPQSEMAGKAVYQTLAVVELRFAGDRNYSPVLPADSMYRRDGHRVITYAERWADQYHAFMTGGSQIAQGTPLEQLTDYGITPAELSLCRAMKIYSVEALHGLDGPNLKSLGPMNINRLKDMARRYMADSATKTNHTDEIEALKKQIAALQAAAPIPAQDPTSQDIDAVLAEIEKSRFASMSKDEIKEYITKATGVRPQGNPSIETLVRMAEEIPVQ